MSDYTSAFLTRAPQPANRAPSAVRRALTLSLGTHAAALAVLIFTSAGRVAPMLVQKAPPPRLPLAWAAPPGPGGGVGSGGEDAPASARPARIRTPPPPALDPSSNPPVVPAVPAPATLQPAADGLDHLAGLLSTVSLTQPASRGPGSGPGVGGASGSGVGGKDGSEIGSGEPGGIGDDRGAGGGGAPPRVLVQVPPQYTNAAMQAKVQGVVLLEALVRADGSVGDVRVVRSLDPVFGLDQQAIRAVKNWRFAPGSRREQAVPMLVTVELTFTIR